MERRWRLACERENKSSTDYPIVSYIPTESEIASAFIDRKTREGSVRGFGIRQSLSVEGSDSWVDDPITRHIISLHIKKEEERGDVLLWPLILHVKGHLCFLVLPLVEPHHLKAYMKLCKRPDCGNAVGADESLSSLLIDLPSITGYVV